MSEDSTMDDAMRLLEDIQEQMESYDKRPNTRFEARVEYDGGEPDCTCGVCGDAVKFERSNIVDGDEFEYSQWDSKRIVDADVDESIEFEQDRICMSCQNEFVQNGGRFDQHRYDGWTECDECLDGKVPDGEDFTDGSKPCSACGGSGAVRTGGTKDE